MVDLVKNITEVDPFEGVEAVVTDPFEGAEAIVTDPFEGAEAIVTDPFEGAEAVKEEASFGDNFGYAFDSAGNITENVVNLLESYLPISPEAAMTIKAVISPLSGVDVTGSGGSGFYKTSNEKYGKGFYDAEPKQRLAMIADAKVRELDDRYGDVELDKQGIANMLGSVTKGIADPLATLPVGKGIKTAMGVSAGLGASYSVTEDLVKGKDVDWMDAAMYATVAGGMAGVLTKGISVAGKSFANKSVTKAQEILDNTAPKEGVKHSDVGQRLKDVGWSDSKIASVGGAITKTGRKLRINEAVDEVVEMDNLIGRHGTIARTISENVDKALGALSTRIHNISPPLHRAFNKFEFKLKTETAKKMEAVEPFAKSFKSLSQDVQDRAGLYLMNGEFDTFNNLVGKDSLVAREFKNVIEVLDNLGVNLKEVGRDFGNLPNYFPRNVKDFEGLLSSMDEPTKKLINKGLNDFASKNKITVREIPQEIKGEIARGTIDSNSPVKNLIDRALSKWKKENKVSKIPAAKVKEISNSTLLKYQSELAAQSPSSLKARGIDKVRASQNKNFYADPIASLHRYISGSVNDIETRRFFGKNQTDSIDDSIGNMVQSLGLDARKASELSDIMTARFVGGNQGMNGFLKTVRDTGYMSTIAQPDSALIQFGDVGVSGYMNGLRNTARAFFGEKNAKIADLGLDNTVMQELLQDRGKFANVLDKMLEVTQFKRIDKLGKETFINAAWKRATHQAKNPKKVDSLKSKWGEYYGKDFDKLTTELKSGELTPLVKEHLFAELAGVQPITMLEMPAAYASNPNARLLYMLKSFTLKQWDLMRREVYQEYKAGRKVQAMKNFTVLTTYLGGTNLGVSTVRDLLLGRDVKPEDIPAKAAWTLAGIYGFSKYGVESNLAKGDAAGLVVDSLAPPIPMLNIPATLAAESLKEDPTYSKVIGQLPAGGRVMYNWFYGGAEKFNERQE